MEKRLISESFKNRMQELAGIIQENPHKIMKLGFDEEIAHYLGGLDKKRGLFFADSLTKEYAKERGIEGANAKQILQQVDQDDLFAYMKSKDEDIRLIIDWIKSKQGQVNIKEIGGFEDVLAAAKADGAGQKEHEVEGYNFDKDVERFLRGLEYDYGPEVGVIALKSFVAHNNPNIDTKTASVNEMINSVDPMLFLEFLRNNEDELSIIIDWANSPLRQEEEGHLSGPQKAEFIREKGFENLEDALAAANIWHSNLTASGKIMNPDVGKIVERYADGYYWKDLETNVSKDEAQAMGHCGTDRQATTLLSLRDPKGEPHVTMAYNEDTGNITQIKGKNNKRPVDKYMNYVKDYLEKGVKNNRVKSFNWSYGRDLEKDEVEELLKKNMRLYFNMMKAGIRQKSGNLGVRY